jgi:hypothetical protein
MEKYMYFGPQVGISGTRRAPHDLAASLWGGKVYRYEPKNKSHRSQYQWSRVGASAVVVLELIEPFLLIKRDNANLAIQLWEHVQQMRTDDPFPWFGPNYDPIECANEMREEMIELNQSRNRVGKTVAGRLLDDLEWNELPRVESR